MYPIAGRWEGALMTDDGHTSTPFALTQPAETDGACSTAALTLFGRSPRPVHLLEGARSVLVALADAVPDPVCGCVEQLLVEGRVLGDRLVGRWLRRDINGVLLDAGPLTAVRAAA